MKNIIITIMTIIAFLFVGCGSDDAPENQIQYRSAYILYSNGTTVMGTTKAEPGVNGGFQIYGTTGHVNGFIQADGSVNDVPGNDLGVCVGANVNDYGVDNCILPTAAPKAEECPDTRNGDFNPSYSTAVCNANGYFWCSIAQACLDKPINVNECGEIADR